MNDAMPRISNTEDLLTYISQGNKVKYLFFWGHTPSEDGSINKTCFSQWYEAGFKLDGIHYSTAEHYMMAEKARIFKDNEVLEKILKSSKPDDAKKLGRAVKGYQENIWKEKRFDIVVRGNQAKFTQNEKLKEFLINTGDRVLVEASPKDRIWGIGMGQDDSNAENPANWQGLNLLGFALMEVRIRL